MPCKGRQHIYLPIEKFNCSGECKWFNDSTGCRFQPPPFDPKTARLKEMDEDSIKVADKFGWANRVWLKA